MVFSLFSGAGGFDWGFHRVGYPILIANDIKEDASETYSKNFGLNVNKSPKLLPNHYNVWNVEQTWLGFSLPNDLILIGGPPCQDFSTMRGPDGKRLGTISRRGKLYLQYVRYVAIARPRVFVFENVPGLMSSNEGNDIKAILEDFGDISGAISRWEKQHKVEPETTPPPPDDLVRLKYGDIAKYRLVFKVVNMAHFGVPQNRRRLIIIGIREDISTKENLKEIETLLSGNETLKKYPLVAIEAFEGKVILDLNNKYQQIRKEYEFSFGTQDILEDYLQAIGRSTLQEKDKKELERAMEMHEQILAKMGWKGRSLTELGEKDFPDGSHEISKEKKSVLEKMYMIPPGENHAILSGTKHELRGTRFSNLYRRLYRRLHPLMPSHTVLAHGGGGTYGYHYERGRSQLTNRERARLQGFPDDFLFVGKRGGVRSQIGEAVPPIFSYFLSNALSFL